MSDKRIVYINEAPYFKGEYKLNNKLVKRILAGRWKGKDDEYIIKKLAQREQLQRKRIGYHQLNKQLLEGKINYPLLLALRMAIVDDLISKLRKDKSLLRKELNTYRGAEHVIK